MTEQEAQAELDSDALTVAHVAVEDVLIERRDRGIGVLGPANGLVVKERDGTPSPIMRMGTREALQIGITAYLSAARHSPRVVEAAPSDTDRRLIDALRRKARFFERPEGEGENETELLLNQAADALSRAFQPVQVEVTDDIGTKIAELSEWIDGSYPESLIGTELHVRRRVDKLMEESGEVGQAVGGWFGENPRKGVTHTRADVLAELLDVAVTALGAYESLTGNAGSSIPALDAKLNMILERAGLSAALGGGDHE